MSKRPPVFIPLITVSFLPLLTLALYPFGYSVSLGNYEIPSAVSAIICLALVFRTKESNHNKSTRFFIAFLPLIQLINALLYVYKSKSLITAAFMAVCFISCAVIGERIIKSDRAKIFSVITSSLLFVVIVLISFVTVFFGNFSVDTVVKTVESPDREHYAEVLDSDQGATGGSTVVYIRKSDSLKLLILEISETPERIYMGEWREYETMDIEWKNENTLLINSTEYNINT